MELDKIYTPSNIEDKWYKIWEDAGYFKPKFKPDAPSYCICLPPPNVTGTLHMGHGFQHTLMDALIRYYRMRGYNTLWQAGTDHAGIATQLVVERQLQQEGVTREQLGREEFLSRVWLWKRHSGNTITQQMRRLGASCDWSRQRFTLDDGLSDAVIKVFINLYERGYIYRGKRLVNWDVSLQTAVSDLEVVTSEEMGSMWSIRYNLKDCNQSVVVATTRPETMLGDVAIAVNPEDERYQHLIGRVAVVPLVNREIPIIADNYVDKSFGTGCVKITPAHDFNDYELANRHNLTAINIFTTDGYINTSAASKYQGLERFAARKKIIADLEACGHLIAVTAHKLMIPRGEKTNVIIEPMLTNQWFLKMDQFATKALELVGSGKINFVPANWKTTYDNWLNNIQDWCISRQLWWGHRIPAYYDEQGNVYVASDFATAVKMAGSDKITQESDVLDTWFSAALWPFSSLGWPSDTNELKTFFPTTVLVTGFDIIFFWVARMIMLTHEFTSKIPFSEVYITGLIQDANGVKMSKTKGNVIDPLDLIDGISLDELIAKRAKNLLNSKQAQAVIKQTQSDYPQGFIAFGADALRFTFATLATYNREIRFDIKRLESSRNFCNKLWNATRFVLMNIDNNKIFFIADKPSSNIIDRWIMLKLSTLIAEVHFAYQTYRFDIMAQKLYEFVWNDYCDWYLELSKVNLQRLDAKITSLSSLLIVLEYSLRLLHPLIPFITEELWQSIAPIMQLGDATTGQSLMNLPYPTSDMPLIKNYLTGMDNEEVMRKMQLLQAIIIAVRNLRSESGLNPGIKVPLIIEVGHMDRIFIQQFSAYIQSLAKVSEININDKIELENAPIAVIGSIRFMLVLTIDKGVESLRLTKEIEKHTKELERIRLKLDNPQFILKAPPQLVKRDTVRAEEIKDVLLKLSKQLQHLDV